MAFFAGEKVGASVVIGNIYKSICDPKVECLLPKVCKSKKFNEAVEDR